MDKNINYLQQRRNRKKQQLRTRLGILQMIHKPILNLFLFPILVFSAYAWIEKDRLYTLICVPKSFFPIWRYTINIMIFLIFICLILGLLDAIGTLTAQKDEGDIEEAFEPQDLRNGCPILMNKKKIKGSNVTMREFYSSIPMKRWIEKMDDIADSMNVHFVEEVKYGKSNGKRIVIYTAPCREATLRGDLFDDEF